MKRNEMRLSEEEKAPKNNTGAIPASLIAPELVRSDIRVLIADDEAIIRTGIRKILEEDIEITVVGEAHTGESAVELVKELNPDVVLMDISMPGHGGIEATRQILFELSDTKEPNNTRILALSVHSDEYYPSRILNAGASGYITKGVDASEMLKAIKDIHKGEKYICQEIAKKLNSSKVLGRDRLFDSLNPEEINVCAKLVMGMGIQDIADELQIRPVQAESLRRSIFNKLDIENEVSLVHLAIKNGLLDKDDKYSN